MMVPKIDRNLKKLFEKGTEIRYSPQEVIIRSEDKPQGIYYLKSGYVKYYAISYEGKELIFNIFRPHTFFPIAWILAKEDNFANFEALTGVTVCRLPKRVVLEYLRSNPRSMEKLARRLSSGLVGLSKNIEMYFLGSAKSKVSFVLVNLAERFGKQNKKNYINIDLPTTHQLISGLAGLVRETVSVEMDQLRKEKLIKYSRKSLEVLDIDALRDIAQK